MHGPVFGEFLGTAVLIFFGDGVVANVLLNKSKGQNGGWMVVAAGWSMAVFAGIITSLAVGGVAHLNPAITLAFAVLNGSYSIIVPYCAAQIAGAFAGAVLVWLVYLPHWAQTPDPDVKLIVFCTKPAIRHLPSNALTEFLATAIGLVLVGMAIGSRGLAQSGFPPGFAPCLWGLVILAVGLSLGGPTGYAVNPARDLGARLAHQLLPIPGKRDSDWSYGWVPIVAPALGGIAGALLCRAFGIM